MPRIGRESTSTTPSMIRSKTGEGFGWSITARELSCEVWWREVKRSTAKERIEGTSRMTPITAPIWKFCWPMIWR